MSAGIAQAPCNIAAADMLAGSRRMTQNVTVSEDVNMMNRETRWWWIRHAPVTRHAGRIYGQQDVPADFSGTDAAVAALAEALPERAALIASDLRRAVDTASAIATTGIEWTKSESDPAFREQHFGEWQGLSTSAFAELRDGLAHGGWLAPAFERPPGGESFADVIARVVPAVIRRTAENAGQDIVAVAHGGSIRAALSYALGIDPESALAFSLDNLSLTRLDHIETKEDAGVWRVVCINRVFV